MGDFYELELQSVSGARAWSIPETKGGGPSARESHTSVAYNGLGSLKLYIFGGMQGRRLNDLWQLDLGRSFFFFLNSQINNLQDSKNNKKHKFTHTHGRPL